MSELTAYRTLYSFIHTERAMREYVFRNQPAKLITKTNECDQALAALEWLRVDTSHAQPESTHTQDSLL